jgi:hypothetical protein
LIKRPFAGRDDAGEAGAQRDSKTGPQSAEILTGAAAGGVPVVFARAGDAPSPARDVDNEPMLGWGVVAAIATLGGDA